MLLNADRWANYISPGPGCKFPLVYISQKLWKLAGSRQSYCRKYQAYVLWPTLYTGPILKHHVSRCLRRLHLSSIPPHL